MLYLTNAFSLQMLVSVEARIDTTPISFLTACELWSVTDDKVCGIEHADLAAVTADALIDSGITANRVNVRLEENDTLLVAQLTGGHLPEGATALPEGFEIEWVFVKVKYFTW